MKIKITTTTVIKLSLTCYLMSVGNTCIADRGITLCIINNFQVSNTMLLGGANFGQSSIKYYDPACNVEPLLLKNCKRI